MIAQLDRGADNLAGYIDHLQAHPAEYQKLVSSFLIKVTEFFRDPDLYAYLRESILPELVVTARKRGNELRLWSAGCATGEEAYSLAILLREALGSELDTLTGRGNHPVHRRACLLQQKSPHLVLEGTQRCPVGLDPYDRAGICHPISPHCPYCVGQGNPSRVSGKSIKATTGAYPEGDPVPCALTAVVHPAKRRATPRKGTPRRARP